MGNLGTDAYPARSQSPNEDTGPMVVLAAICMSLHHASAEGPRLTNRSSEAAPHQSIQTMDTGGASLATIWLCLRLDVSGIDSKQP